MNTESVIKNLHPLEIRVLRSFKSGEELTAALLAERLSFKEGHANQAFSWLAGKGLAEIVRREKHTYYEITELGRAYAESGLPEARLYAFLQDKGAHTLPAAAAALHIENKDVGSAFGALAKDGALALDADKKAFCTEIKPPPRLAAAQALLEAAASAPDGLLDAAALAPEDAALLAGLAKKRGAADSPFRLAERETAVYALTEAAEEAAEALERAGISGGEIGAVTPELLASGEWKDGAFRRYNISVPPARIVPGRTNPYADFLEGVKDKLCSLGFEEFDGPLVETEFWNSDALFMPQFHPARDIHDVYSVKNPTHAERIDEPFLSNVAAAHENGGDTGSRGWGYAFDRDFTRRLILRSQGTALSAHRLATAKVPGKYFGVVRCFRYDKVDAMHLSDFYQTEGIVLGEEVNLRTLLGFLEMFAVEIAGAADVKYVPGYFPFTEPSVEVHVRHPTLGWFELGGSGIFRPEVTKPMGVSVPVIAWGIGIDRMALMALGLNDLRELFSTDIEQVRLRRGAVRSA
jgi:phenylalanyl-tRNA synthetase alpha chain